MKTSEAIKGREEQILEHYGLPEITGNRHFSGECPICGKRKKFRLHYYNGELVYVCVCGHGGLLTLICTVTGREFKDVAGEIDQIIGNVREKKKERSPKTPPAQQKLNRFSGLHDLKGTPGEDYLKSRRIEILPKLDCKYSYSEWLQDQQRNYAAIKTLLTGANGRLAYEHNTYLENGSKAEIDSNKRIFTKDGPRQRSCKCGAEHSEPGIARLFPIASTLGIAEGLETALSASQIYNVPVWMTANTGNMKKFRLDKGVNHLIIFADNDANGAGLAAAFECGHRNILANNDVSRVTIRYPESVVDFNDMLFTASHTNDFTLRG